MMHNIQCQFQPGLLVVAALVAWRLSHTWSSDLAANHQCNEDARSEQAPTDKSVKAPVSVTHDCSRASTLGKHIRSPGLSSGSSALAALSYNCQEAKQAGRRGDQWNNHLGRHTRGSYVPL